MKKEVKRKVKSETAEQYFGKILATDHYYVSLMTSDLIKYRNNDVGEAH